MADFLEILRQRLIEPFQQLPMAQRMMIGLVTLVVIIGTIAIVGWAVRPEFAYLAADMDPAEAQTVVEELEASGVQYQLAQGGRAIMVPRNDVYEWRMRVASRGLSGTSGIGYELFDQGEIGVSEFVQQINLQRAIEGELTRTIISMPNITNARVHLVFPKDRLFKEDEIEPTASIFVTPKNRNAMTQEQIRGIAMLVAGAVEGLNTQNITVMDERGNILSRDRKPDSQTAINEGQLEIQFAVETYLEGKTQSMLERVLGDGNVIVRANAELDFRQIEMENQKVDPENQVVLSEEMQTQTASDSVSYGESGIEHTITNYEVTKSVERIIGDVGSLKRLSVAVIVNNRRVESVDADGNTVYEMQPRAAAELEQIQEIARNAIGFSLDRGDQLVVQNLAFEGDPDFMGPPAEPTIIDTYGDLIQKIFIGMLIFIGYLVVSRRIRKAIKDAKPEPEVPEMVLPEGMTPEEFAEKEQRDLLVEIEEAAAPGTQMKEDLSEYIIQNPGLTANVLRAWMLE